MISGCLLEPTKGFTKQIVIVNEPDRELKVYITYIFSYMYSSTFHHHAIFIKE